MTHLLFDADHPDEDEAICLLRNYYNPESVAVLVKTDLGHNDGPWSQCLMSGTEARAMWDALGEAFDWHR